MSGFSIPSIMPSQVLSGAISRWREHQESDLKEHRARRDAYIAHLGQLMNVARDGDTINWLSNEIVRAEETPDEKLPQFKGKPLPVPMSLQPPGTPAQGASKTGGASGVATTPPAFDFSHVMQAITGQSAAPDNTSGSGGSGGFSGSGGGLPLPDQITSPTPPVGIGGQGPFTGSSPLLVPPSGTSSSLPSVAMTPPGHSVPEPSPLVGTLPGTPSPSTPSTTAATPPPIPFQPRFMGVADRLQTVSDLKAANAPDRSTPTPANMVAAARNHQVFQEAPDGTYYLRSMTPAEYTEFDRENLRQEREDHGKVSELGVLLDPNSTPEQRNVVWSLIKAKHQHAQRERAPIRYARQILEQNGRLVEVLTNPTDPNEPPIERELPLGTSKVDANKGGHLIPMSDVLDRQAVRLEATASMSRYEDVKASALTQARKFRQQASELRALERTKSTSTAPRPQTYKQTGTVHLSDGRNVRAGTDDGGKTFYDLQTGKRLQ